MGMSYIIDTHILLWWLFDDPKLDSLDCRNIIREPNHKIFVSSASTAGMNRSYFLAKTPRLILISAEWD